MAKCLIKHEEPNTKGVYNNPKAKDTFVKCINGVIIKSGSYKDAYRHFATIHVQAKNSPTTNAKALWPAAA